jgi:ubiquinol-cytochrome c reductase cytochrome c subunit
VEVGHRPQRTPRRSSAAIFGCLAAAAIVLLFVIVDPGAAVVVTPGTDLRGEGAAVADDAARLYLQNCASCHGPKGEGTSNGPSLAGVGAASVDFYLRTGRMPLAGPGQPAVRGEPRFSEEQIQALVAYVTSTAGGGGPEVPAVQGGGDVRRGWELYTANCAACHAATGGGNAVGGGFAAVGLGRATPTEIGEAMAIGPGAMPVFEFEGAERDDIVAYIEYLRSEPPPGGVPIGGNGPVSEGFVAVAVGLPLAILAAWFVGRRSHEGEPGGRSVPTLPDDGPDP